MRRERGLASRARRGTGFALLYVAVIGVALLAIASLAVDYGRVQLAKTQLRSAADAAARAAVVELPTIKNVEDTAVSYAALNLCDGKAVQIDKNKDVDFGDWDNQTRTFTVLVGSSRNYANAVRVKCRQTIPLLFTQMSGVRTCDVTASATASIVTSGYGMVGLDFIKLSGNATASYWSSSGTVGGNAGHIASNGNITSTGSSTISGTVWTVGSATVTGVTSNARRTLAASLSYPNGDPSPYDFTNNDNYKLGSYYGSGKGDLKVGSGLTVAFPAGNYVVHHVDFASTSTVSFTGPTTIYYWGDVKLTGKTLTNQDRPKDLKLVSIPGPKGETPGTITVSGSSALYANIYAPQSQIKLSGSGAIYGSVLGKSVDLTGTSDLYYDLSLPGAGNVQLVQ